MISLAIIFVGIAVGLLFFRRQTKKVLLVIALSIAAGGGVRLIEMARTDQAIVPALLSLAVLGAIWLIAWLANRSLVKKPAPRLAAKTRGGPPRVGLR